MRLLLDTHIVLWQLSGERRVPESMLSAMDDADDLLLSVASYAEIGVKAAIGKLEVPDDLEAAIERAGVRTLGLTPAHGLAVSGLPLHHRDPFDRILVAQAIAERLSIVTADPWFRRYGVHVIDGR